MQLAAVGVLGGIVDVVGVVSEVRGGGHCWCFVLFAGRGGEEGGVFLFQ